jgi:hypothetical protein
MDFDAAKVTEMAARFDKPRNAGTVGAREAAAIVAEAFERAGLIRVVLESLRVSRRTKVVWWLVVFGLLVASNRWAGSSWWASIGAPLAVMAAFTLAIRQTNREHESTMVIAAQPASSGPFARMIVATDLSSQDSGWVRVLSLIIIIFLCQIAPPRLGAWMLFQWIAAAWMPVISWLYPRFGARPIQGDNRSGLAMVIELSRSWREDLNDGVEMIFASAPNMATLTNQLKSRLADGLPTLYVALDAPGVGREIRIVGKGAAHSITVQAAEDLWLPYKVQSGFSAIAEQHLPTHDIPDCFALCGAREDSPIDPAMLSATAQLLTETALRWIKHVHSTLTAVKA